MSKTDLLYLRQNIQLEPLVDLWYAWSHLIPPATAARNVTERHVKIMDSYINAPMVHANAVKNPLMLGGPFIDYQGERVDEIRALRDRTLTKRPLTHELSQALKELANLLKQSANGKSLQPLYQKVPDSLRGYVELLYDLNGHATYRLIEPLLYRSKYYDRSQQSIRLSLISQDDRPFVLSTPRLPATNALDIARDFADDTIDNICHLKTRPKAWNEIKDIFGGSDADDTVLHSLLTTATPQPYRPYSGAGIRWRYFGHACILVEVNGVSILVDPVLSYTYESRVSRYTYADLPPLIDYVLITHNHQDHILFETLLQLRHKIRHILVPKNGGGQLQDPSIKLILENCGFSNVTEVGEMESISESDLTIMGLPFMGEHADLNIQTKLAWLIKSDDHQLVFAADSCNVEARLYEHIQREIGDIDVLFIGMECDGAPLSWLYGPLLTDRIERSHDESRRLAGSNCEQAMAVVDALNCKEVYVYAMGQEPWLNYIMSIKYNETSHPIIQSDKLLQACRSRGITAERLFGEREMFVPVHA